MKQRRNTTRYILVAGLLAVATTLACAQDRPDPAAGAKVGAQIGAKSDSTAADAGAGAAAHSKEGREHPAEPSAADLKTKLQVKMALLEKLGADSLHVEVSSHEGQVGLSGVVEKRETRELAETMAKSIPSVSSVRNDIRLDTNVANPNKAGVAAGEAEAELKDALLSTKVRLALVDGLGSDGFRIGTEVANGVVTLQFGPELALTRRDRATRTVEAVQGVSKVVSVEKTDP